MAALSLLHKWIAFHPCKVLWFSILLCFALTSLVGVTDSFTTTESGDRDFLIDKELDVQRLDAITLVDELQDDDAGKVDIQSQYIQEWSVSILFQTYEGKLTPAILAEMYEVEEYIEALPGWEDVCYKGNGASNKTCAEAGLARTSLTDFIPKGSSQTQIDTALSDNSDDAAFYLESTWSPSKSSNVEFIRTFFKVGFPIAESAFNIRYSNSADRVEEQEEAVIDWSDPLATYVLDNESENLELYFYGIMVTSRQLFLYADRDVMYSMGSIVAVFLLVWYHTRSLFLASIGMLEIILSFPVAFALYRFVIGIEFIQTIHMLAIFIVLGIGADNYFVYMDAWRQAILILPESHGDILARVEYTHTRATRAMLATTFTTVFAFAATGISGIAPVATFGIFAALLLASNFLLVITLFAAAVVIYEQRFAHFKFTSILCPWKKKANEEEDYKEDRGLVFGPVEIFFRDVYAPFIQKVKYPLIVVFLIWLGISAYFSSQFPPLSAQEEWFPDSHPIVLGQTYSKDYFTASDATELLGISIVWGLEGVDRSGTSRFNPEDYGVVLLDDSFSLSTPEAQQHILDVCNELNSSSELYRKEDGVAVECFMWDFKESAEEAGYDFPLSTADFNTYFQNWTTETDSGLDAVSYNRIVIDSDRVLHKVSIDFELTISFFTPYSEAQPEYETWELKVAEWNEGAPTGVNNAFQSSLTWAWIRTESALVKNAISGMGFALIITCMVLLIVTHNVIVSMVSTLCILGTLTSVVSGMYFTGAEFGTAESIASVMLIGFSVDYVVHLANHYVESSEFSRYERMQESLRDMGISVVFGGLTTASSAFFLWFATMLFFTKFAFIMTVTVVASWFWSLGFFSSVMMARGPEGDYGNIKCACLNKKSD